MPESPDAQSLLTNRVLGPPPDGGTPAPEGGLVSPGYVALRFTCLCSFSRYLPRAEVSHLFGFPSTYSNKYLYLGTGHAGIYI